MERLSINYKDNNFGPDVADECTLRALIGPDGLSFSVRRKFGKIQYLQTWSFDKAQRENALRRILNNEELPSFPFQQVELMYCTPTVALTPKRMFDAQLAGDYLHTLTDQLHGKAEFEALDALDLMVIWANETKLTAIGDYFFPNAQKLSYTVGLIEALKKYSAESDVAVCVHIRSAYLQIAAFERGNILFFNTFAYEKPSDVLYFTLLVYDQFHLKASDVPLYISGELLKDSEIYKQYERFIRHTKFLPVPPFSGVQEAIMPHIYLDQTMFL